MKNLDVEEFVFFEKPREILKGIHEMDEAYATKMSQEISVSYGHISSLSQILEDEGLVSSEHDGRKSVLSLTEDGERVIEALENLEDVLESVGENQ